LTSYEVRLKLDRGTVPVFAEKFSIDGDGYTVFYALPGPGEKFEEVARFSTHNVANIEETVCP